MVDSVTPATHPTCPAPGWAIWITGRPGSGKTTIARGVAMALAARGVWVTVLDAASFGAALVPGRTPSEHELELIHRAVAHTARLLTEAGVPVIVDATAHRRGWRQLARTTIAHFAEIQLVCTAEVCCTRERAVRWNLIAAAGGSEAPPEPDVLLGYETSLNPELTIDTEAQYAWTAIEDVLRLADALSRRARAAGRPSSPDR